ncbi:MAG TPA: hypothetical protein VE824_03835 [Gaiellales bacterium]|nr:hypothetical protein [Gaiellales bacterium]
MTLRSFVARQVSTQRDDGELRWVETRSPRSDAVRSLEEQSPADVDPDEVVAPVVDGLARLVDCDQVATRLGVARRDAALIVDHPRFPDAVGYFRGRRLWKAAAVDDWRTDRRD